MKLRISPLNNAQLIQRRYALIASSRELQAIYKLGLYGWCLLPNARWGIEVRVCNLLPSIEALGFGEEQSGRTISFHDCETATRFDMELNAAVLRFQQILYEHIRKQEEDAAIARRLVELA